jgi:hypothetical protein
MKLEEMVRLIEVLEQQGKTEDEIRDILGYVYFGNGKVR